MFQSIFKVVVWTVTIAVARGIGKDSIIPGKVVCDSLDTNRVIQCGRNSSDLCSVTFEVTATIVWTCTNIALVQFIKIFMTIVIPGVDEC